MAARPKPTKKSSSKTEVAETKSTETKVAEIQPAKGKLGVMIPGMGAVATTFVAGVEAVRKGLASPFGSLTQMGTIRLGKRTDGRSPKVKEFLPLAALDDLVFTGWDPFDDDMYTAARKAGVLERDLLDQVKPFLSGIKPRPAVFDRNYVKKLDGHHVKKGKNKMELAEQVRADIRDFKKTSGAARLVTIWCGSTEIYLQPTAAHQSLKSFEKAMQSNDEAIAPSMIYAYASLMEGVPLALLTAMSRGLPIVTTDVDGCKEAIVDEVCGLLVPPRQESAMADAMARLLADDAINVGPDQLAFAVIILAALPAAPWLRRPLGDRRVIGGVDQRPPAAPRRPNTVCRSG